MSDTSEEIQTINVRNQVLLERLKKGQMDLFLPYFRRIERSIRTRLINEGDTIETKKRFNDLIRDLGFLQKEIYSDFIEAYTESLNDIAIDQADFEAETYNKIIIDFESIFPTSEQVIAAVRLNPMQIANYAGDSLIEPFMRDWSKKETDRILAVVQQGYAQGRTNDEIVEAIRGTKANNFKDGAMGSTWRSSEAFVRTTVQHAAMQGKTATMKANSDLIKGYKLVVTFDSRTTNLCRSLGQLDKVYQVGSGVMPPLHVNCRDTINPVLDSKFDFLDKGATRAARGANGREKVPAKLGSYDWLKSQPRAFQEAAIGKERTKLLNDGGLTTKEFANLSLDKNLRPLTLKEMKKLAPSAFEKAGIDL